MGFIKSSIITILLIATLVATKKSEYAKVISSDIYTTVIKFDLNDFNAQLRQLKKMGPINQILGLMPGMDSKIMKQLTMDDRQLNWTEAIINSMTINERKKPENINGSRRLRISKGSGRSVQEVNALLKQFYQLKKMMKKMKNYNKFKLPGMADFGKF